MLYYKTSFLLLTMLFMSSFNAHAQRTTIPGTNATFELPANWVAENVDGQLFIMSAEEEGFILLSANQMAEGESLASLQTNKIEESGIVLNPTNYQLLASNRAAVDYTGDMFGIAMEGYAQMGTDETNDWAALALFFSEKGGFAERHKNAVEHIVKSLQFPAASAAAPAPNSASFNNNNTASSGGFNPLVGAKLYYESSSDGSDTKQHINLCANGSFSRTGYSATSYAGMGYSEMDLRGYGQWEAIPLKANTYKVLLHWADGKQGEFIVESYENPNVFFITNANNWQVIMNGARCN